MLTEQSIPFVGIDTTAPGNRQLWNDIKFQTKSEAVPMVFIRDKKTLEGTAYIPNQDFISTEEIVEIIKKNI
jgi:glutaredoxin